MLPISRSDRILSWAILGAVITLVYRRVRRMEAIDQTLDPKMLRFLQTGEAGKELIMRSEDWIRRA